LASPAYERILEIQALDQAIDQRRHRIRTHPARARVEELDGRLAAHGDEVQQVEERRHAVVRDQKRLQDEVATIAAKRAEIDGKLYDGSVQASKELLALQGEAAQLLERQTGIEDDELELMEQLEEIDGDLGARAERRAGIEQERSEAQAELDTAVADLEGEMGELTVQREGLADGAVGELLARYDELRSQYDGHPVARLTGGHCDGCHMQLSAVAVDQMAKMPEDAVVTCEECGRMLVR
jgi:predicted  nucleic acid-binding Zn-ribbon protein